MFILDKIKTVESNSSLCYVHLYMKKLQSVQVT